MTEPAGPSFESDVHLANALSQEEARRYREGFENIFRIVIVQGLMILLLTGALCYYVTSVHAHDRFFAVNDQGTKVRLLDLGSPTLGTESLLSWATLAASDVLTFGFNNVDRRFAETQKYFTQEGWEGFRRAMGKSGLLANVVNNQQIITAIPRSPARLVSQGLIEGGHTGWVMDLQMVMTTRAGKEVNTDYSHVSIIVVKVPTRENPRGVGIYQWVSL